MGLVVNTKIGTPRVTFTPEYIRSAYKQYENGSFKEIIQLMKYSSIDSHVAGCLIGRKAGFQRDFSILPWSDKQEDVDRAAWIEGVFNRINARTLIKKIHEAALFAYQVIEFNWIADGGRQTVDGFKIWDQKYFKYDPDGILRIDFGKRLEPIPEEVLVCETIETPIMIPVLRDYVLKDFGLESWASFIETFGEGFIIGKYPPGADPKIISSLKETVDNLARSSRGTMPDNASIDIVESKQGTSNHFEFIDVANRGIAISILGHANSVQQSQSLQVGENLSAYRVKGEIAKDDMFFIDEQAQKLVNIIYKRNFADDRVPRFSMDKRDPINVPEWLQVLQTAWEHGVVISPDEYRKLGLHIQPDQDLIQKLNIF